MIIIKIIFLLSTSLLLTNCANNKNIEQPTAKAGSERAMLNTPAVERHIEFYDSEIFDLKLGSALLAEQPTVEVKVIVPFTVNQIPKRMDIWLSAVHNTGGSVQTKPDPEYVKDRAFISEIVDLVIQIYKEVKEVVVYGAAANYNLTIFYIPNVGTVTKMVFTHK